LRARHRIRRDKRRESRRSRDQRCPRCGKVRLDGFGQGDIIKRRRRAKGQAQRPTRIIAQEAKHWLLGLERNGVRRFHIRDGSCYWWCAGHTATGRPRVGETVVVQEIGPKQLVIGDGAELALLQRAAGRRWTRPARDRRDTLAFRKDDDITL